MRKKYLFRLDTSKIKIESKRLIIRGFTMADLNDLNEYASVDGVGQMAGWLPHKDLNHSKAILLNFILNQNVFALELKENKKVIGSISIEKIYRNHLGKEFLNLKGREIGYVLNKEYWGQQLMPEAVNTVVDYLFKESDYNYLMCAHFENNLQSKKVIEKTGFKFKRKIKFPTLFNQDEIAYLYYKMKEERGE